MGLTSTTFKNRHSNHRENLKNKLKRHNTELLNYIKKLKDTNKDRNLKWVVFCRIKVKPKNEKSI